MKKLFLIILTVLFCVDYSDAQIEFQGILYNDYAPGVKVEFELINTSANEIEDIHIQIRQIVPDVTPSFGVVYSFDPPLQPGELRWIDPFDHCIDAHVGFATEFEAKIYNIDGQSVQISQVLGQVFTEADGCSTLSDTGAQQIFCEECGVFSHVVEIPREIPQNTLVDVYNSMGELILFQEEMKEIQNLPKNQLFFIQLYTKDGYQIYKITITQ